MGVEAAIKATSLSDEWRGTDEVFLPEKSLGEWGTATLLFLLSVLWRCVYMVRRDLRCPGEVPSP